MRKSIIAIVIALVVAAACWLTSMVVQLVTADGSPGALRAPPATLPQNDAGRPL